MKAHDAKKMNNLNRCSIQKDFKSNEKNANALVAWSQIPYKNFTYIFIFLQTFFISFPFFLAFKSLFY